MDRAALCQMALGENLPLWFFGLWPYLSNLCLCVLLICPLKGHLSLDLGSTQKIQEVLVSGTLIIFAKILFTNKDTLPGSGDWDTAITCGGTHHSVHYRYL